MQWEVSKKKFRNQKPLYLGNYQKAASLYVKVCEFEKELYGEKHLTYLALWSSWHHYMMHSASKNCGSEIRMATVSRLRWEM